MDATRRALLLAIAKGDTGPQTTVDVTPRLVFADYLEEQDSEVDRAWAALIRLTVKKRLHFNDHPKALCEFDVQERKALRTWVKAGGIPDSVFQTLTGGAVDHTKYQSVWSHVNRCYQPRVTYKDHRGAQRHVWFEMVMGMITAVTSVPAHSYGQYARDVFINHPTIRSVVVSYYTQGQFVSFARDGYRIFNDPRVIDHTRVAVDSDLFDEMVGTAASTRYTKDYYTRRGGQAEIDEAALRLGYKSAGWTELLGAKTDDDREERTTTQHLPQPAG